MPPSTSTSGSAILPEALRLEREKLIREAIPKVHADLINHARATLWRFVGIKDARALRDLSHTIVNDVSTKAISEAWKYDPTLSPDGTPRAWLRKGVYYAVLSYRKSRGGPRPLERHAQDDEPDVDFFDRIISKADATPLVQDPEADEREAELRERQRCLLDAVKAHATAKEWAVLRLHAKGLTGEPLAQALSKHLRQPVKPGTAHVWHTRATKRLASLLRDHPAL